MSGGTALESSSAMAWIAGVVALLLIGGGTIYFLSSGNGNSKKSRKAQPPPPIAAKAAPLPALQPDETPITIAPDVAESAALVGKRTRAAASLRDELNKDRLWSEVEISPADNSTLILRSAHCADAKLKAAVATTLTSLQGAKFKLLRCQARHGSLVFEQKL